MVPDRAALAVTAMLLLAVRSVRGVETNSRRLRVLGRPAPEWSLWQEGSLQAFRDASLWK